MLRACVAALVLGIGAAPAHAYEFWLRAQTIGQAYQLRDARLIGPDLFVGRRRYTQTLALRIWDVGDLSAARRRARQPDTGLRVSWHSFLRVDHEFGSYANSQLRLSERVRRDAIDTVPEIAEQVLALDLLYGYLSLDGIADGRVSAQVGRVLADEGWGPTAVDGAAARFELPPPIAITASAGLRVRAASPLGLSAYELDGTTGAGCREYVEGATPGTGTWKLIDRDRTITNTRFASDYEYCPQREVAQPTVGVRVATSRLRRVGAELGYRRTWSSTVGVIGDRDRLGVTDLGLYPNEAGQAPDSGVNEERVWARAHGAWTARGVGVAPYANARYSFVHAALDRAELGVQLARGRHALEPAVAYFFPTFDSDSIFNVFSIEPTTDARLGYAFDGPVRATASGWLRRYGRLADGATAYSGGADAAIEHAFTPAVRARGSALWDAGYGGRRIGGSGEATWRVARELWLRGRAIVLGVAPEDTARYVTTSGMASATWRLADAVGLHAITETSYDEQRAGQVRVLAVLDLAFAPEP